MGGQTFIVFIPDQEAALSDQVQSFNLCQSEVWVRFKYLFPTRGLFSMGSSADRYGKYLVHPTEASRLL